MEVLELIIHRLHQNLYLIKFLNTQKSTFQSNKIYSFFFELIIYFTSIEFGLKEKKMERELNENLQTKLETRIFYLNLL